MIAYSTADLVITGNMSTGAIFPMLLIYAGLTYGYRGTLGAALYCVVLLLIAIPAREAGIFNVPNEIHIVPNSIYTIFNILIATVLMWLFTSHIQRSLTRITRTAAQTRATSETGQILSRILNIDELLTRAVDVIRDRFALYHAQIFIVDDTRTYANLAASTGQIGQALLAQGFRVALNGRTVVGDAITSGHVRHISNLAGTPYRRPELLTDTRSQAVIPLRIGDEVIGALDVQSLRADAFTEEDIEVLQVMGLQLNQSIQNARLFESQQRSLLQNRRLFLESETNLREIERLNRQLTGQSWQEYLLERGTSQYGIQLTGPEIHSGPIEWTSAMQQAVNRHRAVSQAEGGDQIMAVPISIRGQAIGAIEVRVSNTQNQAEIRSILQAVTERMAFSLENARLFEQAQLAAAREQQINQITSRLQGLTSIEDVLNSALSALGQALNAEQGTIRLIATSDNGQSTEEGLT
jgi:GAF domain-containing protein